MNDFLFSRAENELAFFPLGENGIRDTGIRRTQSYAPILAPKLVTAKVEGRNKNKQVEKTCRHPRVPFKVEVCSIKLFLRIKREYFLSSILKLRRGMRKYWNVSV